VFASARGMRAVLTLAAAVAVAAGALVPTCAFGVAATARPRAIIVLVDSATLADVTRSDMPGFLAMRRAGSMGLTTIPLGVGTHNEPAYATIGQGSPVAMRGIPAGTANAYESSETVGGATAAEVYQRTTGVVPPTGDAIVNPQIVALSKA